MSKPDSPNFQNQIDEKSQLIKKHSVLNNLITLIYGPMFAGKTQELLSKLSRHEAIGQKVLIICSLKDKRDNLIQINSCTTHRKNPSSLENVTELKVLKLSEIDHCFIENHDVIGIDEGQFFDDLLLVKNWLLEKNKIIYIAGLMSTSEGNLFGEMYKLIPFSKLIHLTAVCKKCYEQYGIVTDAIMTACLVEKNTDEMVGFEEYVAMCFAHWREINFKNENKI